MIRNNKTHFGRVLACLAVLALFAGAPVSAQLIAGANAFPTGDEGDGKFVALAGTEFATLTQGNLSFSVQVPLTAPGSNHSCLSADLSGTCVFLGIFDGETTGASFAGVAGTNPPTTPDERIALNFPKQGPYQHWDNLRVGNFSGAAGTQLGIALFRDPNQIASTAPDDFLGYWEGNSATNPSKGLSAGDPDWVAFGGGTFEDLEVGDPLPPALTAFVDNGWWNLELEVNSCVPGSPGCAQAATGVQSFHLCLFYNPDPSLATDVYSATPAVRDAAIAELCRLGTDAGNPDVEPDTVSVFKVQAEAEIVLLSDSFAFEGAQHNIPDIAALYPEWPPGADPADPFFVPGAQSTYDGNWEFLVAVPADVPVRTLSLYDGDFDFGTRVLSPAPARPGFVLEECVDDDDRDSPLHPAFAGALSAAGTTPFCRAVDPNDGVLLTDDYAIPPPIDGMCASDGSVAQTAKTAGTPADDNFITLFRRLANEGIPGAGGVPGPPDWPDDQPGDCVVYRLTSPGPDNDINTPDDNVAYHNSNPSSQREWEQFRILSRCECDAVVDGECTGDDPAVRECECTDPDDPIAGLPLCPADLPKGLAEVFDPFLNDDDAQADFVVNDATLPSGLWKVEIFGVDMSNLNAWTGPRFCPAEGCVVGPTPPYKVGDTVFEDPNGNGVQDPNESGIPLVKVNLLDEVGEVVTMKLTGQEGLDQNESCEECNTGGDPSGPADPSPKNPVDEEGLFCFDVNVPPDPNRCSVSTSRICSTDDDCRPPACPTCNSAETCEPPLINVCSVDTQQACSGDADCPAGQTCIQNCRDLTVEVDDSNFEPGGPLDGFGPTTPSPRQDCQICQADGGAVTLNCDFGYAPCAACDGKVTQLSLRYLGGSTAVIRVDQKNGDTVFGPAAVNPGEEFSLGAGTDKNGTYGTEILLYVNGSLHVKIHTSCSQPIYPGLIAGDFEVTRGASRNGGPFCPAECRPIQVEPLEVQDDELKWRIGNEGSTPITVSRVVLEWPVEKGNLKKIELDGTFFEQLVPPPTADISSGFVPDVGKRTLDVGEDKDLKFRFDQKFDAGSYFIRVEFGDSSCSLETSGAVCQSDCQKPIHDLSMIWNGSQTVNVTAWKGSPGSTSLGTQTAVPGQRITFGDFEGSPNDVVWEIFDLGGAKLGESKFHLSCSDDEMNGAEDCGRAQGNGKGNDGDLINDWIFDGWRDADETLSCTPEPICEPSDPPPGDACLTDCQKPIHDLSMIWNGAQTVKVEAWKGSPGSTSLGIQTVAPGERVTFGDFEGSPNDVIWEIFDLNDNKIGESKFHLSCSDDEMDGADDCGRAEGNGKGNDGDLINDWIFDGWRDADETLSCSPEPICEPSDPPPSDACLTDCKKPIHDLSMIWNGAQTVKVEAWKGSPGSTSLGIQTVAPGERVTFGDFAGSPNDVIWEIFDLNDNKIGESKFHLSCSDDEMDGADDCGRAEGNGKSNDGDLINDWIFDGWRDADETLSCSPEPICQ